MQSGWQDLARATAPPASMRLALLVLVASSFIAMADPQTSKGVACSQSLALKAR